jgi:hypothetical protein
MRFVRAAVGLLFAALLVLAQAPGFRSRHALGEHYAKHVREFGNISQQEYLHRAQALRDTPAGGPVLEADKRAGVVTKFDRRNGYFVAYNADRTIRTFFIPVDGERYFRGQARRPE